MTEAVNSLAVVMVASASALWQHVFGTEAENLPGGAMVALALHRCAFEDKFLMLEAANCPGVAMVALTSQQHAFEEHFQMTEAVH